MPFLAPILLWLAEAIIAGFGALFTWFALYLTKRLAIIAAAIAIIVSLVAGLFAAFEALLSVLIFSLPPEYSIAIPYILPSNMSTCVSIIVSAHLLRYAYDWNVGIVKARMYTT